jgi:hypothetical protein
MTSKLYTEADRKQVLDMINTRLKILLGACDAVQRTAADNNMRAYESYKKFSEANSRIYNTIEFFRGGGHKPYNSALHETGVVALNDASYLLIQLKEAQKHIYDAVTAAYVLEERCPGSTIAPIITATMEGFLSELTLSIERAAQITYDLEEYLGYPVETP